jgi:hypothetical protein
MITEYIELHNQKDKTRTLVPVESVTAISEVRYIDTIIKDGQASEVETIRCQVIVFNTPFFVSETYNEVKQQINNIKGKQNAK